MQRYFESDPRRMAIGHLVATVGHLVGQRWRRTTTDMGLGRTPLSLLMALADEDNLTQRDLARMCRLSPATLTPVVDSLEADGLINRQRDTADRRQVRLRITDRGRQRLDTVLAKVRTEFGGVFPAVSEHDEQVIRDFLAGALEQLAAEEKRDHASRR